MTRAGLGTRLACTLACGSIRALGSTWRVTWEGLEHEERLVAERQPVLYALVHGRLVIASYTYRDYGIAIMVSKHEDGEVGYLLGRGLGFAGYRGSTTRGGSEALLEMCRAGPEVPLALSTDGPRGPAGSVQPGIVLLAQKSRRPVVAVGFAARPALRFRSWDRHLVPAPFARVHVAIQAPVLVPADLPREGRLEWAERIRLRLEDADRKAWAALAGERAPAVRRANAVLRTARARRR